MIYEIINISDPYTIAGENFAAVCMAVSIIGEGQYALRRENGESAMPAFLFGGHDKWFLQEFGKDFSTVAEELAKEDIAEALESVLIGNLEDRRAFEAIYHDAEPAAREEARQQWHEERITSLNDIGATACEWAASLRQQRKLEEVKGGGDSN